MNTEPASRGGIFAGTALGALMIAVSTVSYQALKAALVNPARNLRTE